MTVNSSKGTLYLVSNEPSQTRPELEPLEVDGINAVKIGTLLWTFAFFVSAVVKTWFADIQHTQWWSHVARVSLCGVFLGLLGLIYTRRRVNRLKLVSDVVDN